MDKFIYVFSKLDRDWLINHGYTMFQSNENKDMYVFINDGRMDFSNQEIRFALSNTLSF
mgnify:CR=1 FL=1